MERYCLRFSLQILVLSLFFSPTFSYAQEPSIKLCPALSNEKVYDEDNADFRFLVGGKEGWIFRTDYDLKQKKEDFELSEWSRRSFERLHQAFQYNGTELAVAMIPPRGMLGYPYLLPPHDTSYDHNAAKAGYKHLLESLKSAGLIVADTVDADTVQGFFLKRDNHWTAIGSRYVAQKMAEAIKVTPFYAGLTKTEFETTSVQPQKPVEANYNFLEFIEEKCGTKIEREKISEIYTTARKQVADVEEGLLSDTAIPEVVLIGTSNSTEPQPSYANFSGFLREYLGVDITNNSIKGGSMRGAMGNYILNGDYKKHKPKIVIWELSATYGFEQKSFFREIIPAIYGVCSDEDAIAKSEGQVNAKETAIFNYLGDKMMISNKYYLVLELEDKDARAIKVDFLHMKRDKPNTLEFERSLRNFPVNDGVYFAELKKDIEDPVENIKIKLKNGKGSYKAKMCKIPESRN